MRGKMIDKIRNIAIIANVVLVFIFTVLVIYLIWLGEGLEDIFFKTLGTYAVIGFSSLVIIKFLDYLEHRNKKGKF